MLSASLFVTSFCACASLLVINIMAGSTHRRAGLRPLHVVHDAIALFFSSLAFRPGIFVIADTFFSWAEVQFQCIYGAMSRQSRLRDDDEGNPQHRQQNCSIFWGSSPTLPQQNNQNKTIKTCMHLLLTECLCWWYPEGGNMALSTAGDDTVPQHS